MNNALSIQGLSIAEVDGLFSLNDLHKASGGLDKHSPKRWKQLKRTKELIKQVDLLAVKPPIKTSKRGGTYVDRLLVYSYAMHISPAFEIKVIEAFDRDAQKILNQAQIQGRAEWHQNREQGKYHRHDLTDVIQKFVAYANAQGCSCPHHYYTHITRAVNKSLGIESRDSSTEQELNLISSAEIVVEQLLLREMGEGTGFKEIYSAIKERLSGFVRLLQA